MMTTTSIIRAEPEDAAIVALLGRITFAETFGYLFRDHADELRAYLDTIFGVAKVRASLGKPENAYWLALSERLPVSYAKIKHPSAPSGQAEKGAAQLQKIYVLNEFHGEGIGKALLQQALNEAERRCAPTIGLDVLHENKRAIEFHKTHGFAMTGEDRYTIGSQTFRFILITAFPR